MNSVTAIVNGYRRPNNLPIQVEALRNQTNPPDEIWLWMNYHEDFDKEIHKKYLNHIDINNLKGLKIEMIFKWKIGETLIMDRSHIHSASSNIIDKKIGLTTFTKK